MGKTPHLGSKRLRRGVAVAASVATVLGTGALAGASAASAAGTPATPAWHHGSSIKHVLLISVDGLHPQGHALDHREPTRTRC